MSPLALLKDPPDISDILVDEVPENRDENFQIDSLEKAAWAARKYLQAKDRMQQRWEQANSFKEKIDLWFQRANSEDESTMEYMMNLLKPYIEKEVALLRKSKTIKAPGVNISFRKKPNKVDIIDENLAIQYCEENQPQIIQVKKTVSKSEINKLLTRGELIPGVEVLIGEDELQIKAK